MRSATLRLERKARGSALGPLAEDGTFEGYAALFNRIDLGRDLILPGAFSRSLAARGAGGVRMLFQHDPAEPIGVWLALREDAVGLFVRGRIAPEVTRAREVLALLRAGALDGLSIGFRAVEGATDPRSRIRRLSRIDLWEISVVTFPMQPEARIAEVKESGGPFGLAGRLRRCARRLRTAPVPRPPGGVPVPG
ncbi:HK97 family phage prohead protease [Ancylobacter sp. 6x-1]|uniref:HK97 family phage prohead protease n=1 Tax=Ancylobacter crimeensis TaxID=2579147 RepID=A0ABT0D8W7_9HYPH|nr:HK97 family phage prohead protease [Ancylobacter crimeensis]MCK0196354.1 HK97 family phage prohead protease [Ancylobacter crimeensis]